MEPLNWPAVLLGTALAFALGMLWFSPRMFGSPWARGSHGITPPATPPWAAMAAQLAGTFFLALLIGLTARTESLGAALAGIGALALLMLGGGLFSQKTPAAALIDAGFAVAMGVIMIVVQGVL